MLAAGPGRRANMCACRASSPSSIRWPRRRACSPRRSASLPTPQALIADPGDRPRDARARRGRAASRCATRSRTLRGELRLLLLPRDEADDRSAILEVRAGTGGDEAALFAGDLFRMYERYAALHGWKVEVLSASDGEMGGYREIVAAVRGAGVYARLKFESGVHRVQRVPHDGGERAHPHLRRHRRRAAGGRGRRHRDQAGGHPHRHDARLERRRPARQHHRDGGAHPAHPDRHHRDGEREVAAPEPRARHAGAPRAALRPGAAAAGRGARRRAQGAGRLGRPLGAHPHLQFPAGRG